MTASMIALLVFLATVSILGMVILAVQDLRAPGRAAHQGGGRLQRRGLEAQSPRGGPIRAFDRWFGRLVQETGLPWSANAAALLMVFCGLFTGGALFTWNEQPLPAALGLVVGACVPLPYLLYRRGRRIRQLQDQLAPALELLARSVRSGQTLDQAMDLLGRHSPEPMATEFRSCAKQLEMGLGMPAVMRSLVERVRLYDVRIFATTLVVHRETGGNIAVMLERLARVIRDRLSYRRQLRVATAAGRISAGLVSLITPAVFLFFFFVRPYYVSAMLQAPLGQALLVGAVFLEVVGLIWTARLLRPAY